jgi:hypothetical protein
MDSWTAALLVVAFGLMMTVIGVAVMIASHLGRLGRHITARGLVALLYGAWALLVGGILFALTELDISILLVGAIVGATGLLMLWAHRWVAEAAWGLLS